MQQKSSMFEEQILLGGQISNKHQEYKKLAQNTPPNAKAIYVIDNFQKLLEKEPLEIAIELLTEFGKIDNLQNFGEITKLSMIVGDPRTKKSGKGIRDILNKKQHNL